MFTIHDLTTRELLNAREAARHCSHREDDRVFVGARTAPGGQTYNVWASYDEIVYALSCREHVPSKKEAQVIRQLKAKTKQSEEWLRAHPKYGQEIADACTPDREVVSVQRYQKMVSLMGKQTAAERYKIGETNV